MAEQERMTNKERRAKAREERKRKEAEAARKRRINALRNGAITAVIFALVAAVVVQAVGGGPDAIDDPILISSDEVEEARQAAGCEVLAEREPLPEAGHLDRAELAQIADVAYPEIRPTHSGPHTPSVHPPVSAGASSQIDEFTTTHNLEHGAVIVWYDPEQVDDDTAGEMGDWSGTLNESGFMNRAHGSLIFVSPYEDPGIASGKAVAMRAWGTAVDCDEWDETVANAFVAEHFGTRGIAPERAPAPYPDGTIEFEDRDVDDTPEDEAPVDEDPGPGEADLDEDPDEVDDEDGNDTDE